MVAEKSLTEKNVHMYYIRVKEGKNEKLKKEGKLRISILISIYTVHLVQAVCKGYQQMTKVATSKERVVLLSGISTSFRVSNSLDLNLT